MLTELDILDMATVKCVDEERFEVSHNHDFLRRWQFLKPRHTMGLSRSFSVPSIRLQHGQITSLKSCQNKIFMVSDLRCVQTFARTVIWKPPKERSTSYLEVKSVITETYQTKEYQVSFHELNDLHESSHVTVAVILPEHAYPNNQLVVLEVHDSIEKQTSDLMCGWLAKSMTIKEFADLIIQDFGWREAVVCVNGRVAKSCSTIESISEEYLTYVQVIKPCRRDVSFIFHSKPKVYYTYMMELDMSSSIGAVKEIFLNEFTDDLLIRSMTEQQILHVLYNDTILEDQVCIGLVLRNYKYRAFQLHIAMEDAICITLHYLEQKGKVKHQRRQQILVKPNCSTSEIREEAARYLKVDPKAVKLTIKNRRIEETSDMQDTGILARGIAISAGTKKKKMIQVRHPITGEQIAVNMYMLETVAVLKRAVAEQIGFDEFLMSFQCRGVEMIDSDILQNYPIKNKMELTMTIHPFRIIIMVVILFKNVKVRLVVDDFQATTVENILTFCAQKYRYIRQFSRALYQHRCLNPHSSLVAEGVTSLSTIYITFFQDPSRHLGDFYRVFQVRRDGQANTRLATVCRGHLFYAPTGMALKEDDDGDTAHACVHLPGGIRFLSNVPSETSSKTQCNDQTREPLESEKCSATKKPDKNKYLRKAREVRQKIFDREQTSKKLLALSEGYNCMADNCKRNKDETPSEQASYFDRSIPAFFSQIRAEIDGTVTRKDGVADETICSAQCSANINNLDSVSVINKDVGFDKNLVLSESTTDVNDSASSHDQRKTTKYEPFEIYGADCGQTSSVKGMSFTTRNSKSHVSNMLASNAIFRGRNEGEDSSPTSEDSTSSSFFGSTKSSKRSGVSSIKATRLKTGGYKTV